MNCKNCGAKIRDNERVCPNCGAFVDDGSGYTLLTSDERLDDFYSSEQSKPKKHFRFFLVLLLVIALSAGGAYVYYSYIQPAIDKKPSMSFTSGTGIINADERVIYVTLDNGTDVEYIGSASLSAGETKLTESYEYTKNIDSSFRAVFFDTEGLTLEDGAECTVNLTLGINGKGYEYSTSLTFEANTDSDASDLVFDHSMSTIDSDSVVETTEAATTQTTEAQSNDFIYKGYWYTAPVTNGDTLTIDAYRFDEDKTFSVTTYTKKGNADWSATADSGNYEIEDGYITVSDIHVKIDYSASTLTVEGDSAYKGKMTNTVHNSLVNAQNFFS